MIENFKKHIRTIRIEFVYLVIGFAWGTTMVFLTPPFQVADETHHYYKSASIAEHNFVCESSDGILLSADKANFPHLMQVGPVRAKESQYINSYSNPNEEGLISARMSICYSLPFGHIISGSGLFIGDLFTDNELISFYFGRMANLLFATILTYYSIKRIPYGKRILFIFALLPMTLFQYASYSYDAIHISLFIFYLAYILDILHKSKQPNNIQLTLISILITIISNIKIGYYPLFLSIFLLPFDWKNKRRIFKYFLILIFTNILLILIRSKVLGNGLITYELANPIEQIKYIITHPIDFSAIIVNTFISEIRVIYYGIISRLGWGGDYYLIPFDYYQFTIFPLFFIFTKKEKTKLTNKTRVILLLSGLLTILLVSIALYVINTQLYSPSIRGLVGRYFTLPLLLIFFALYQFNFREFFSKHSYIMPLIIFLSLIRIIYVTIQSTFDRFY